MGYSSIKDFLGTTAFDWRCDAVEFADQIVKQNQSVLETHRPWQSINLLRFSSGKFTYYLSNKTLLKNLNGDILGTIFVGSILDNDSLHKLYNYNLRSYYGSDKGAIFPLFHAENNDASLTSREHECLFYYLRGKPSKVIAQFLNISPRTVETYIDNIKIKYNCISRSQLIEKCVNSGLIYSIPAAFLKNIRSNAALF